MKTTKLILVLFIALITTTLSAKAANEPEEYTILQKNDTITVTFGESQIVIVLENEKDVETLEEIDLNEIVGEAIEKLKNADSEIESIEIEKGGVHYTVVKRDDNETSITIGISDEPGRGLVHVKNSNDKDDDERGRTYHSTGLDIGLNTYLGSDGIPSGTAYDLKPFGSRYVAINSMFSTRLGTKKSPFYVSYGLSVSWHNFMFDGQTSVRRTTAGAEFYTPEVELEKSKLTAVHLNAPVMFRYDPGFNSRRFAFQLGIGGYVGYRLDSYTKQVYFEDNDKERDRDKSNFHMNDIRYGLAFELGVGNCNNSITLFGNYDLNPLFREGKGPELTPFSFGIRF